MYLHPWKRQESPAVFLVTPQKSKLMDIKWYSRVSISIVNVTSVIHLLFLSCKGLCIKNQANPTFTSLGLSITNVAACFINNTLFLPLAMSIVLLVVFMLYSICLPKHQVQSPGSNNPIWLSSSEILSLRCPHLQRSPCLYCASLEPSEEVEIYKMSFSPLGRKDHISRINNTIHKWSVEVKPRG